MQKVIGIKRCVMMVFLLGVLIVNPYRVMAQEDGYKNLKWGMTLKEMEKVYINEDTGTQCKKMSMENINPTKFIILIGHYDKTFFEQPRIDEKLLDLVAGVSCDDRSTGIMVFKKQFFAYVKNIGNIIQNQQEVMPQLKNKYPSGQISMSDKKLAGVKYPEFSYLSSNIGVFNDLSNVYFASTKMVNEIVSVYQQGKQAEEQKKKSKSKLF